MVSTSLASPCALNPTDEAFHEIAAQTLRKDPLSSTLVLDPLPSGVQNEVDQYLNKNIFRSASGLVWISGQPGGVLVAFMEGSYRVISAQDTHFLNASANALSSVWSRMETWEAFKQAQSLSKPIWTALRKQSTMNGNVNDLVPCILVMEPVFVSYRESHSPEFQRREVKKETGARGEAHAKRIADMNTIDNVVGGDRGRDILGNALEPEKEVQPAPHLSPTETVGIIADFAQMLDVLADRYNIKRPKKFGNLVSRKDDDLYS